ncbi:hypothetical protein AAMO2058_001652100 [Amorphochlora amoebiformis]
MTTMRITTRYPHPHTNERNSKTHLRHLGHRHLLLAVTALLLLQLLQLLHLLQPCAPTQSNHATALKQTLQIHVNVTKNTHIKQRRPNTTRGLRRPPRSMLKLPKGTRDFGPQDMALTMALIDKVKTAFKIHGAVEICTPVFETTDALKNKYGEESKLIFNLQDEGGEALSLRYDLTVPLARYMGSHNLDKIKRFQIGKVYRRDQPTLNKGRFREFYQCDFDICGSNLAKMAPDAEVIKAMEDALESLKLDYTISVNHRGLLSALANISGIPSSLFVSVCASIDKLDKKDPEFVIQEIVQKGVSLSSAMDFVSRVTLQIDKGVSGVSGMLDRILEQNQKLSQIPKAIQALEDLRLLTQYLQQMDGLGRVRLDLSLARGLDYYTGVIFEAKLNHKVGVGDGVGVGIGSIGGGGRYDNLIGMFGSKQIPAVGCSIGIERILAYLISIRDSNLKARRPKPSSNATTEANDATTQATDATPQANDPRNQRSFNGPTQASVLVATIDVPIQHKMRLCSELWRGGISAQMIHTHQMKPRKAIEYALDQQVHILLLLSLYC